MSQKKTSGPCGFPFVEIIDMADRFGTQAATFGLTDPQLLNEFCLGLGDALTWELPLSGMACDPEEYVFRVVRVAATFSDTFIQTKLWSDCAELGPYSGPLPEDDQLCEAVQTFFDSFCSMREVLGVSASELLDLLAWIQFALGMRLFHAQCPHMASTCDPRTVPMHS
tara:strand:- start:1288 stop:1791 length:504 start_codon:yes stop_codon:yes gene_type:complete